MFLMVQIQTTKTSEYNLNVCVCFVVVQVPDRGGRVWEQEPPPPEMPSFMKRVDQPQGQRPNSKYINPETSKCLQNVRKLLLYWFNSKRGVLMSDIF